MIVRSGGPRMTVDVLQRPIRADRRTRAVVLFLTNGTLRAHLLPRHPQVKDDFGIGNAAYGPAVPTVPGTVLGFAAAGFDVATLVPAAMHEAGEPPGLKPGSGLAVVSWPVRLGFLRSPPWPSPSPSAASASRRKRFWTTCRRTSRQRCADAEARAQKPAATTGDGRVRAADRTFTAEANGPVDPGRVPRRRETHVPRPVV
ncbi:hypothetical protein GCM10019016_036980 [Streptomyces prasinosporus]|uniref:Uncharacterized protein n=1 Tax=Streptomyces prasinosporus TaxID=68256 RepID=A0ABP6TMU2_9ACTN